MPLVLPELSCLSLLSKLPHFLLRLFFQFNCNSEAGVGNVAVFKNKSKNHIVSILSDIQIFKLISKIMIIRRYALYRLKMFYYNLGTLFVGQH